MKNFFLLIFTLLLSACHNYKADFVRKDGFNVILIDKAIKEQRIKLSSYIDKINYIPLETNTNVLIGKIEKIGFDKNYIYLLDRYSANSLFVFDFKGKFIAKIGNPGKGPGEYNSAQDFCILPGDTILLYDRDGKKIIYYHNFKFLKSQQIDWYSHSFAYNEGHYYFYMQKQYFANSKYKGNYDLIVTNPSIDVTNKSFAFESNNKLYYDPINVFRNFNDSIQFMRRFQNKLYKIKGSVIAPSYYLDFGQFAVPYEKTLDMVAFNKSKSDYSYLWNVFLEGSRLIYFDAVLKGDNSVYYFFYNKVNNLLTYSNRLENDIDGVPFDFCLSTDSTFIGSVNPIDIINNPNINKEKLSIDPSRIKTLDNPIIAIYKLK